MLPTRIVRLMKSFPPGCHLSRKQVSLEFVPVVLTSKVFDNVLTHFDASPVVHFRSSSYYSPDGFTAAFYLIAHYRVFWIAAASGGLKPAPASRLREATIPSSAKFHRHGYLCSWHTPIRIFQPLRDNRFIGACEGMFEVMKTGNQSRGQARSTLLFGKKLTEGIIQYFPINQVSELVKFVFWI
jgi:hypothetical protein